MSNHLRGQSSPYLLQHAENPVDWYPWCAEAFRRAREEDKPVFLSIGYSTCHWCHVMARESFADPEIAGLLNRHFISIKVDKEERPDLDGIYMAACQAFTGSGGWPMSVFLTAEQKPFFAGTYFPKTSRGGRIGLRELLTVLYEKWQTERPALLRQADTVVAALRRPDAGGGRADEKLIDSAAAYYRRTFDSRFGGFGDAPKFPAPHNLLFLLARYARRKDDACLEMAEKTLLQMYRGGLFDHVGFGFCRYSTDRRYLVPHFEKMLYDNALLILAYCEAFSLTGKRLYLEIAEKTAEYVLREMTAPDGGFYSAQDADSDGEEGGYYLFAPDETIRVLGPEAGSAFNRRFDIREPGSFEGRSIPNLLHSDPEERVPDAWLRSLRAYRRQRHALHLDDKILTAWNGLMIAALCRLGRAGGDRAYLEAAKRAEAFLRTRLRAGDTLYVSNRDGIRGEPGFLDDYAAYLYALLALYETTFEEDYLDQAKRMYEKAAASFWDDVDGGFYQYGAEHEQLILRPKETYDGAAPSGNSLMAWNLARLWLLTSDPAYARAAERQMAFLAADAAGHPAGYAMFLTALLDYLEPPVKITAVLGQPADLEKLPRSGAVVTVLPRPTREYPLCNGKTTFYVCRDGRCLPPVNDWP